MLIVIAIGGNALENLARNCQKFAAQMLNIAQIHDIVLVHGNGPQVGLLALQAEADQSVAAYPFDILVAESQGLIGYMLQQALHNALPTKQAVTILTQVVVAADDPGFLQPSKPIGAFYSPEQLPHLPAHWRLQKTAQGLRRIVASPEPKDIIELVAIQQLIKNNNIVIAGGGGGIPCVNKQGKLKGIEAVIDKDLTASLLARLLNADRFLILTNVDAVYKNWHQQDAERIDTIPIEQISALSFELGSMQPKITAACQFAAATHHEASIGHLDDLDKVFNKQAGTHIRE